MLEGQTKVTRYTRKSENIILPRLYRAYYLFLGWYTENEGGELITNIPTGSSGNKTLYAHWQALGAGGSNEVLYVNPNATYHYGTSEEYGLANLTEALEVINRATAIYHHHWTIKIKGVINASCSIDDSEYYLKTYVDSITLEGISESSAGGPVDGINGGFTEATENGAVLSITTKNPVTIKNLKISGGNNSGNGGGLYVDVGNVTLSGNTRIENCSAKLGGGIYIAGGSVTMNDDTLITGCVSQSTDENNTSSLKSLYISPEGSFVMNDNAAVSD